MKSRRLLGNPASSVSLSVSPTGEPKSFLSSVLSAPQGSRDIKAIQDFSPLFDSACTA